MLVYVDTSAALKLLIEEPETSELAGYLDSLDKTRNTIVSSTLMYAELHCACQRRASSMEPVAVDRILAAMDLVDIERADLWRAARSGWGLRAADAIHLATALRAESDILVAYDKELLAAAHNVGLKAMSPGAV